MQESAFYTVVDTSWFGLRTSLNAGQRTSKEDKLKSFNELKCANEAMSLNSPHNNVKEHYNNAENAVNPIKAPLFCRLVFIKQNYFNWNVLNQQMQFYI